MSTSICTDTTYTVAICSNKRVFELSHLLTSGLQSLCFFHQTFLQEGRSAVQLDLASQCRSAWHHCLGAWDPEAHSQTLRSTWAWSQLLAALLDQEPPESLQESVSVSECQHSMIHRGSQYASLSNAFQYKIELIYFKHTSMSKSILEMHGIASALT